MDPHAREGRECNGFNFIHGHSNRRNEANMKTHQGNTRLRDTRQQEWETATAGSWKLSRMT